MKSKPWVESLNLQYAPMDRTSSSLFVTGCMVDMQSQESHPDIESQFLIQVLQKRIDVFKLPISFTGGAKMAVLALTKVPGATVALLIDCLNAYAGETVTAAMLADLYPQGFYDQESMARYIDTLLKPRQIKWSDIY